MVQIKTIKIILLVGTLLLFIPVFAPVQIAVATVTTASVSQAQDLGWWGRVTVNGLNVRSGPSPQSPKVGALSAINRVKVLATKNGWDKIDGGRYPGDWISSAYVARIAQPAPDRNISVPAGVGPGQFWIDVNIAKETLTLFQYQKPVFATYVSTGLAASPTMRGTFQIWEKLLKARMHGGPPFATHVYDLANVPWTMYYHGSFAVHGTYWHDNFGRPQSAGCTNITQGDAKYIYSKVGVGTVVYNH
ncbi:MAG: L,D-transpeptidase family protein [Candidatus Pacebacteria bacterium]|nr:L,D-transpeptidase family protein [Candidatus Paceibacterota bacterium]MDR3582867.1 L,D-transpeptidase family protein [Candidatus Paceibacterota bacterium]